MLKKRDDRFDEDEGNYSKNADRRNKDKGRWKRQYEDDDY
jgi:hypothetical protein